MPATGLFFLPTPPSSTTQTALPTVIEALTAHYNPNPLGRWTLDHRLMRDTSSTLPSSGLPPRSLQFLNLSHLPSKSFVGVLPASTTAATGAETKQDEDGMSVIQIPAGSEGEFLALIVRRMEPLWVFRQHVRVENGQVFETEDWRVRVGDVRQVNNQPRMKGCVVEVQIKSGMNGDAGDGELVNEENSVAEELLLRRFWQKLGVDGAREFIRVPGVGTGDGYEFDLAKQYMELLRLSR